MKFGMMHFDLLINVVMDNNLIFKKSRWWKADSRTCPRSIYWKRFSTCV